MMKSNEQEETIEVLFRKSTPISDPVGRYPGFRPGTTVLPKGYTQREGALPLPCEIIFERDVAVSMRDGVTIYTDIFRPAASGKVPAIVAWSPYGKESGNQHLDVFPARLDIPNNALSNLMKFEGPDPAYWCSQGYAVINPDSRGAFMSEGDIYVWGSQDAEDGYELIEWLATQEWCNGKVGMTGNSWLAVAQWFIASKQPPHLAAIAPWEGLTDLYGDDVMRGGIPSTGFNEDIISHLYGNNRTEDIPAMVRKYPLMNSYWEDKKPQLEKIEVPAYVVASYTNIMHTRGTLEGFRRISSTDKWLRINNSMEWPDYYNRTSTEDLRRFFDYYLKDIQNGWKETPRVRMSVLDPGGKDIVEREENEFPLIRAEYVKLNLDADTGRLTTGPVNKKASVNYNTDSGQGHTSFTISFDQETELSGYMKLRLWVEAQGSNDMDLFVYVRKLDNEGKLLVHKTIDAKSPVLRHLLDSGVLSVFLYYGPSNRLRVSRRQLDPARSTETEPYLTYRVEERLNPGQIVPLEIPLWPTAMRWHPGEQLQVIVAGYDLVGPPFPNIPALQLCNKGEHIIHTGGEYDSHLLVPVIPSKSW